VHASYLIQWEAIRWAMAQGCRYADLWGIPNEIGIIRANGEKLPKDRSGGLWGVYNFKRGFGVEIEHYVRAYDYAYRRLLYRLGMTTLRGMSVDAMARFLEKLTLVKRKG
jgi:lipid II:glycine glycyltransferase (peptidoglycan interpeptide bridge formation enzyme)